MTLENKQFTPAQIHRLTGAFHRGAAEAADALHRWLSVSTEISIEGVDQCPLEAATSVLSEMGETVCMCVMRMEGTLTGQMILAFDDPSGLVLADLLLGKPGGTSTEWGELEISSSLESMNIIGSAYLNGIARYLSVENQPPVTLIPSPPLFLRDFVESLLESAFVEQAQAGSQIVFAKARFQMSGNPLRWTFLLIPDPDSLHRLSELLLTPASDSGGGT
ncbi:MAG: hypothetical protein U0903_03755 [Planctomycetales bacterium]